MRRIDRIIIHCSATPNGRFHTVEDIDRWHKEFGWRMVGYHWIIRTDGVIEKGRDERDIGSHASGHNMNSVGVCMIGTDKFSPEQWVSLALLLRELEVRYPMASVVGHGNMPGVNKKCPGFSVYDWVINDYVAPLEHLI